LEQALQLERQKDLFEQGKAARRPGAPAQLISSQSGQSSNR